jgi:hypothetical protein
LQKREAVAKGLLLPAFASGLGSMRGSHNLINAHKVVHRHLLDGDVMLTNRQPTLHKPSLMAHRCVCVRVFWGKGGGVFGGGEGMRAVPVCCLDMHSGCRAMRTPRHTS